MDNDTKQNLQHTLLPLADVVTPNLPEKEITGLTIDSGSTYAGWPHLY